MQTQTKDYPERNADAYRYKEATWHQIFKPLAAKGEWSWMVSDRTFVNAFVGRWQYKTDALNYTDAPPAYDTVTLRYWGRFNTSPYVGGRGRWQYNASVSHYIPSGGAEATTSRLGVEVTDETRTYDADARSNGADYQLRFQSGVPYQVVVYNYPYYTLDKMTTQSAFLRDAWRFGDRATLNLGVRWERYHLFLPPQSKPVGRFYPGGDFPNQEVLTWNNWAPRVGLSCRSTRTTGPCSRRPTGGTTSPSRRPTATPTIATPPTRRPTGGTTSTATGTTTTASSARSSARPGHRRPSRTLT